MSFYFVFLESCVSEKIGEIIGEIERRTKILIEYC